LAETSSTRIEVLIIKAGIYKKDIAYSISMIILSHFGRISNPALNYRTVYPLSSKKMKIKLKNSAGNYLAP